MRISDKSIDPNVEYDDDAVGGEFSSPFVEKEVKVVAQPPREIAAISSN